MHPHSATYAIARFSQWVATAFPEWQRTERVANPYPYDERDPINTSFADFHVYERAARDNGAQ